MIVIMQVGATKTQLDAVIANVKAMGLEAHVILGQERTVVAVVGDDRSAIDRDTLSTMDGVERMMPVLAPYKIASREVHPDNTLIPLNGSPIGDKKIAIIAGPDAVVSREQTLSLARALRESGASALFANVFGPKASPYADQGLGEEGLQILAEARAETGLPIVTEVMEPEQVPLITKYADVLQIGGQSMQNFPLLTAVGTSQHTILLKRGIVNTMEELLMAAEYILARGNRKIILCEAGIRTYESYTHNTTCDINAVPVLKTKTHLPIIVDASHAAGDIAFVNSIALATVAAGADGLLLSVDNAPVSANTDNGDNNEPRPLSVAEFAALVSKLRRMADAVGRSA